MNEGTIANVNHSSAQGTLTDVRPVLSLITISILLLYSPLGRPLRPKVRGMERERLYPYAAISDLLI